MRWGRFTGEGNALLPRAYFVRPQRFAYLAGFLVVAVLTVMAPGAALSQSIVDIVAPGAKDYPDDFKFPSKKCEDECRQFLSQLKFARKELLEKFDTAEWRDWATKTQEAAEAAAKLKPFTDTQAAANKDLTAAKTAKKGVKEAQAAVTKANTAADGPTADKKKADEDLKRADGKLPKGNKTSDLKKIGELTNEINQTVAKLKDCLEKCKEKKVDDGKTDDGGIVDGPGNGGGGKKKRECFRSDAAKQAAIKKALDRIDAANDKLDKFKKQTPDGHQLAPDRDDPEYQKAAKELQDAKDELREINGTEVCPGGPGGPGGMYIPGTPGRNGQYYASVIPGGGTPGGNVSYSVPFSSDSTSYCTFGEATGVPGYATAADRDGNSIPVSDGTPDVDKPAGGTPAVLADKVATDGPGVVIKDDPNWTWDPKEKVYVNKKDPKIKRPVPTSVKPGQMWDPDGDPDGKSPIEPETSGNSRTFIDPTTGKIITRLYVDGQGHVYQRDDNFDQDRKPQLVRVYDPVTGQPQRRETIDPENGTLTKEYFDKDGKPTTADTFKLDKQQADKLIKRTEYWPGTDKIKKVEENFDGDKPGKTTEYPQPAKTATDTPQTDAPKTTDQPTQPSTDTSLRTTADNPVSQSTDTPTAQTTDTPPIQITIFIKASEAVLDGGQTGEPIQGQVVKLVMREKPALPTTAENKTDTGYDKPAPQCTTGAGGECKVDVPAEDRPLYAMNETPRIGGKPVNNYRLAINVMKHTGGVAETTGRQAPDLKESVTSGNVTAELVRIGSRTFIRLGFNTPTGATENLIEKYSKLLGVPIEIDICLVKEPGPPLGSEPGSYGAINQELPRSVIWLRPASRRATR